MALEEVVKQCRQRELGGDFDKGCFLISKLTSIEAGVESIRQRLDQRGLEDKRDLHAAFRCTLLLKIVLFGNIDVQTGFGGASDRGQWGGVDLLSK